MASTPTIEAKAKLLANRGAIPWANIIAFIVSILGGLGGICPQPTPPVPPKNTGWTRFVARREFKKFHGLDRQSMRDWGNADSDDALKIASEATPDEWAAMLTEATTP
jgi:hypothetical protein